MARSKILKIFLCHNLVQVQCFWERKHGYKHCSGCVGLVMRQHTVLDIVIEYLLI